MENVIIIGAGLAGLSCAKQLSESGERCLVLEADSDVGGRVQTDREGGFLLDRGFQVLQTAYPEAKNTLDLPALKLNRFFPGVTVRRKGAFHLLADPLRRPAYFATTACSTLATLTDKVLLARLSLRALTRGIPGIYARPEVSTLDHLRALGFSDRIIEVLLRPFFSGVFLEPDLQASSRMFEFVFRTFLLGGAALPSGGMGAISRQLAAHASSAHIRTGCRITAVYGRRVALQDGKTLSARAIVIATEGPEAERLLNQKRRMQSLGATNIYFAADEPPVNKPLIVLNGDGDGPVNTVCPISLVAPSYSRTGETLVSVALSADPETSAPDKEDRVKDQLVNWFGPSARTWRHIRTYDIPHGLPLQKPPTLNPLRRNAMVRPGLFVCGEYNSMPSIHWAIYSGKRAARAVMRFLHRWPA